MSGERRKRSHMAECDDACTLLGYALRRRFERVKSRNSRIIGLSEFDADKTIRLLVKFWPYRRASVKALPLPVLPVKLDFPDKHGLRPAFALADAANQKEHYIPVLKEMEVLNHVGLQKHRFFREFEIDEVWGKVQRLQPICSSSEIAILMKKGLIDKEDVDFLDAFSDLCGELEEAEIVAIGRHEKPESTRDSILWEMDKWRDWMGVAINRISSNGIDGDAAWRAWSFARECVKKASIRHGRLTEGVAGDSELYDDARAMLLSKGKGTSIRDIIERVQPLSNVIWGNSNVSLLGFNAYFIWALTTYFSGTLSKLSALKDTEISRRLQSVTPDLVKFAAEQLSFLLRLGVRPGDRPEHFSEDWLLRQNPAQNAASPPAPPPCSAVWDGLCSLETFRDSVRAITVFTVETYVTPEFEKIQDA